MSAGSLLTCRQISAKLYTANAATPSNKLRGCRNGLCTDDVKKEEDAMYTLKTSACFDSAHFLKGYEGKCSNIHGHRWTVEIEVSSEDLQEEGQCRGMIVDFSTLKADLGTLVDNLDHSLIIEEGSLKSKTMEALEEEGFRIIQVGFRPTAENFAQYFHAKISDKGYNVARTTVFETPNNCATFS